MDNYELKPLVDELCFIYWGRNKLQVKRDFWRHKIWRVENQLRWYEGHGRNLSKPRLSQKQLMRRLAKCEKESKKVRAAIASHVAKTHQRILYLVKMTGFKQAYSGSNVIAGICKGKWRHWPQYSDREYLAREEFEGRAQEHLARVAVEKMLGGKR